MFKKLRGMFSNDLSIDLGTANTLIYVRGQGIGRALIEAVYKAADEAGSPDVYWMTQEFNKVGRRLYDRIGKLTPFIEYNRY